MPQSTTTTDGKPSSGFTCIGATREEAERKLAADLLKFPSPIINPPQQGKKCPITGLSKTMFFELIYPSKINDFKPPVPAVYKKRHPRAKRGRWYIRVEDLLRHFYGIPLIGATQESNQGMGAVSVAIAGNKQ